MLGYVLVWLFMLLAVVCIYGLTRDTKFANSWIVIISTCLLVVALIFWTLFLPLTRASIYSTMQEYDAVQETLDHARSEVSLYERIAITEQVAEMNQWRAKVQYWNDHWLFTAFYPDEVNNLEPIQ